MAEIAKKVKRKSPKNKLMIFIVILLIAVVAIQLFYPATLDVETGKISRLGGKKKTVVSPSSTKAVTPVSTPSESGNVFSEADNPITTGVIE
jgi:hypothetical protein